MYICISGRNSNLLGITLGVPQGSILGPLLFLLYINDLPSCNLLKNSLFADDTMLFDSHEDLSLLTSRINVEFQKVIAFFNQNKLALHKDKTKFMVFFKNNRVPSPQINFNYNSPSSPTSDPNLIYPMLCVNDQPEPRIKFLGVMIDPFLTFKEHAKSINKKLSTGLYFLRTAKNFLNERSLKFLYYALIHCHLIYAIHIYSSTSENILKSLLTQQKKAIRIITKSRFNEHTEPLFKKLQILPFPQLCDFFKLQFMHSFKNNFLPNSFNNSWVTNRIRRENQAEIELRNDDELYIPFVRTNNFFKFPLISFPRLWNNFESEDIKFIRNKIEFNEKLKHFFVEKLNSIPNCSRLLCPSCHLR